MCRGACGHALAEFFFAGPQPFCRWHVAVGGLPRAVDRLAASQQPGCPKRWRTGPANFAGLGMAGSRADQQRHGNGAVFRYCRELGAVGQRIRRCGVRQSAPAQPVRKPYGHWLGSPALPGGARLFAPLDPVQGHNPGRP